MKKYILVVFSVLLAVLSFSLNTNIVKEKYVEFIDSYNAKKTDNVLINAFKDEMENLGLYRFYRNNMVGSAEFVDRTTNIQTYLSMIHKSMNFTSDEEKLAFAGFLCYVQTQLSGGSLSKEIVKSMPAYFTTVQDIYQNVQNEALLYIGNVIAYSMGIIKTSPYTDIEKYNSNAEIINKDLYIYNGKKNKLYDDIIKKNKDKLSSEIKNLISSGVTGEDLEYEIDNISSELLEDITKKNEQDLENSVAMFVRESKDGLNLSFLRYIIYFIVVVVGVKFFKKYLNYFILGIFCYEVITLMFFYNFSRDMTTSFIYGSFIVIAVALIFLTKFFSAFGRDTNFISRVVNITLFVLLFLLLILPTYNSKDLRMENKDKFHNSAFEQQLLKDILIYKHSIIHKNIDSLTNSITTEYSEAKNIYSNLLEKYLGEAVNDKILEDINYNHSTALIKYNQTGLLINKSQVYTKNAQEYSQAIDKFLKASKIRKKSIENEINTLKINLNKIEEYSDTSFLNLFKSTFDMYFTKNKLLVPIKDQIDKTYANFKENKKINIKAYNTDFGTKILMIFFLSIIVWIVFENKLLKYASLLSMIMSSILMFIKPSTLEVLSQFKYPILTTSEFTVNLFYGMIMVLITILLTIKKGGSES